MSGDAVRATAFLRCNSYAWAKKLDALLSRSLGSPGWGYAASEVDDLLGHVAAELDAGRLPGPLVEDAAFRRKNRGPRYDIDAVDWFFGQFLLRPADPELAGTGTDPWRDLAVTQLTQGKASGPGMRPGPGTDSLRSRCATAWRDFGQLPGTHLRWEPVKARFASSHNELRTAEGQTVASREQRHGRTAVSAAGRAFIYGYPRIAPGSTVDAWPPGIAELVAGSWRDCAGRFAAGTMSSRNQRKEARMVRELFDEAGKPVLYSHGRNFDRRAYARITFPDQRWLRFLVHGIDSAKAIMTAVDQAGNKVARYRITALRSAGGKDTVEIAVHPHRQLTDELMLVIAISAEWLGGYFDYPQGG